jgi:hypothetical protein
LWGALSDERTGSRNVLSRSCYIAPTRTAQKSSLPLLRVCLCRGNSMFTELFPSNGCRTVHCLHSCYLTASLRVTVCFTGPDIQRAAEFLVLFVSMSDTIMKSSVFCDITPRSPFKISRRFGGNIPPSSSGPKNRPRNQHKAGCKQSVLLFLFFDLKIETSPCYLLHAGFLFGLFFDSEDVSNVFPRNIC